MNKNPFEKDPENLTDPNANTPPDVPAQNRFLRETAPDPAPGSDTAQTPEMAPVSIPDPVQEIAPAQESEPEPAPAPEPVPSSSGVRLYATNPDADLPKNAPAKKEPAYVTRGTMVAAVCIVLVVCLLLSAAAFVFGTQYKNDKEKPTGGTVTELPEETKDTGSDSEKGNPAVAAPVDENFTLPVDDTTTHYSTIKEIAQRTMNSVVEIRTEQVVSGNFMQQYVAEGAGSGVIITEDGYIVTNNHVIDGASKITVRLRDGSEYDAVLVGTDEKTDVAVVKIDASGLSTAKLGDSDALVEGDIAVVIGNPLGQLGGTVTNGIISALSRTITVEGQQMTLLQTNAAVNPGNSGGGLFNDAAQLVGIVNAKSTGEDIEGIGFAIPINTAKPVIEDLIRYGYARGRVQLGISTVEIFDNWTAMQYRVDRMGVYIYSIVEGSDAEKAGLKTADCIVSVNGTAIESSSQLGAIIQNSAVGDTLDFELYRNRETVHVTVTLTEYKPIPSFQ